MVMIFNGKFKLFLRVFWMLLIRFRIKFVCFYNLEFGII